MLTRKLSLAGVFAAGLLQLHAQESAASREVAEQNFRRGCIEKTMATGVVTLKIATHSCECALTTFERTGSMDQAVEAGGACAVADVTASTTPESERANSSAVTKLPGENASAAKSAAHENFDVQNLREERLLWVRKLRSTEAMLNTPSFAARARIVCRSQRPAIPMLPSLGTVEDLESSYSELMQAEPSTREEEVKRQYTLMAWRQRLSAAYENMNTCQGAITIGFQQLPTNEQEHEGGEQARNRIAEIDQKLAPRK